MRQLPEALIHSLEGVTGFQKEAFVDAHQLAQQVTSIRINKTKSAGSGLSFKTGKQVPWCETGYYLEKRPSFTFDPLFHAGLYYVQEASSMFLEQAILQVANASEPIKALDLCAAPGGKSTHIQSLISKDSLLVSNEVIKSRCHILIDNIVKWGSENVIVTNNDPSAFGKLGEYFDLMVIDAPCSGSGLFRRDNEAIEEWSLNNVQLCCQRQQRILADALPALKENGVLVYSTCSYSKEEDEDIMDWLVEEMEMENITLTINPEWNIVTTISSQTSSTGYRFFPDRLLGEGLFLACFRKKNGSGTKKLRPAKIEKPSAKEKAIVLPWVKETAVEFIKDRDSVYAVPITILEDYQALKSTLNIQYAGVALGQIMKDKLVPAHALAQSIIISGQVPFNELGYDTAIKYLQKQDATFETEGRGWQLAGFRGKNLGWVNVLQNRINNYYPKELRILKQQNDSSF